MRLESARSLKQELIASLAVPVVESLAMPMATRVMARTSAMPSVGAMALAVSAQPMRNVGGVRRGVALGVAQKGKQYRIAVRVQREELLDSPLIDAIRKRAKNEVDVRLIGRVVKHAAVKAGARGMKIPTAKPSKALPSGSPWYQGNVRPLNIGASVGHYMITAGTLGAFVRQAGATCILSNNHVLANENNCAKGDAILQRGAYDGGQLAADQVATLADWKVLSSGATNYIDAAVARIDPGIEIEAIRLRGIKGKDRQISGVGAGVDVDDPVFKVGRTTGVTEGRVIAFDIDNVVVGYDPSLGSLRFDNQIEIEGAGSLPFSRGGDSGSLIVNGRMQAVALLFAGSQQGGSNGRGLTYASPIEPVLQDLNITLLT